MSATFGPWPPAPIAARLVGRCAVNADGTLAFTSKYADGTPVFASSTTGTGLYTLALGKKTVAPTFSIRVASGGAARFATGGGAVSALTVRVYDGSNVLANGAFSVELYD